MKVSAASCLLLAASASAFLPQQRSFGQLRPLYAGEEVVDAPPAPKPKSAALVPIKDETIEFTAGLVGGVAGLAVGGPVMAAITAAAANYVSKMEGEVSDVVKAVSKTGIEVFNYLSTLDAKYEILIKAQNSLQNSLDKLKNSDSVDKEAISKVEKALANVKSKIAEINDEYDLVGGGVTALGVVGDLVEKAVKKVSDLNQEYQLSEKAMASLKSAVEKAKDAAKQASA